MGGFVDAFLLQNLPDEAESVAVHTTAGNPDDAIPRGNGSSIDEVVFLDNGNAEAGEVVSPFGVKPWHFSCFASKKCTTALTAAICDSLDHLGHGGWAQGACGHVVEEKQGSGPRRNHVVDAHRHKINAHPVMAVMILGEFQLGADSVRS